MGSISLLLLFSTFHISLANLTSIKNTLKDLEFLVVKNRLHINNEKKEQFYNCIPLQFNDLKSQYTREAGVYNPNYVATTKREAVLFPNLLWQQEKIDKYNIVVKQLENMYLQTQNSSDLRHLLAFKNEIESKLNLPVSTHTGLAMDDGNAHNVSDVINKRSRSYTRTISRGQCNKAGEVDESTGFLRTCSRCPVTTTFSNRFPEFLNEVVCDKDENCLRNMGACKQTTMTQRFLEKTLQCTMTMQNGRKVYVEKWVIVRKAVRTGCECQIRKAFSTLI